MGRRRRKQLGKPLPPIPDSADLVPTEDDINAARQWAEKHNPDLLDLWDAQPVEDESLDA